MNWGQFSSGINFFNSESEESCPQPQERLDEDNNDPSYQILTDDQIVSEVLNVQPQVAKEVNTSTDPQSFVSPAQECEDLETV